MTGGRYSGIEYEIIAQLRRDENYDRMKHNAYSAKAPHTYFWRITTQQEIDYIEGWNGHLTAFEFKGNDKAKAKELKIFKEKYTNSSFQVITPNDMEDFWCSD